MKVSNNGPLAGAAGRKKAGQGSHGVSASGFAGLLMGDVNQTTKAGPAAPLAALENLLSVQEIPDATAERRRAVRQGDDLLDQLETLHLGLVEGSLSETSIRRLAAMLERERPSVDDPRLDDVLDQIELRAAVELAKLDRPS